MRTLFLSLLIAFPLVSLATAQDAFEDRTLGIGANLGLNNWGFTTSSLPPVTGMFLRFQPSRRFAFEPKLGLNMQKSDDAFGFTRERREAVLSVDTRITAASAGPVALLALVGVSGRHEQTKRWDDGPDPSVSSSLSLDGGLAIEYAPSRHWSVGVDYTSSLASVSRNRESGDLEPSTFWTVGPHGHFHIVQLSGAVFF